MTDLDAILARLKQSEQGVTEGPWEVATSCSWRRILRRFHGDGVIVPTVNPADKHPDLDARRKDLDFVVAYRDAGPALRQAVQDLLTASTHIEREPGQIRAVVERALAGLGSEGEL
ncbi:MAG: hypothetical protein GTN69_07040 [Armatimonadetes bacterium]|nr:hypothetical protein [Armatimonadota bacterium]